MLRPSKMVIERTFESKPSKRLSPRRSKPLSTFCPGSERLMFAVFEAINPPPRRRNALKRRFSNGIFLGFKSLDPSLLNALKTPIPQKGFKKTIKIIGAIEKTVMIVTFEAQDLQALPQSPGSIQPILLVGMTAIATSHWSKRIKTWVKSSVIIVIKKHFAN